MVFRSLINVVRIPTVVNSDKKIVYNIGHLAESYAENSARSNVQLPLQILFLGEGSKVHTIDSILATGPSCSRLESLLWSFFPKIIDIAWLIDSSVPRVDSANEKRNF